MASTQTISVYGLWPEFHPYVQHRLAKYALTLSAEALSVNNLDPKTEILVVFINSAVTPEIIDTLPHLRYIITMSTGYDHIDTAYATKKNILVSNVPSYGENTVAEHTFALILGLTRKLFQSVKRVKEGVFDFEGLRGIDLKDKTLGVIGTGKIGQHVIRIAKGFEMNVVAYDTKPNNEAAKELGYVYHTLNEVLEQSDILTLHTPLVPSTEHLLNKDTFTSVKQGAFLINTARGGLVDPEALLEALNNGTLAGAGLDVLEDENLLQHVEKIMTSTDPATKFKTSLINNLIIDHPKTIVTPHNAFNSTEALQRIIDVTLDNITVFTKGKIQNSVSS
jgi:D-lactate dehydrogenase